jgi:hypothetical protein
MLKIGNCDGEWRGGRRWGFGEGGGVGVQFSWKDSKTGLRQFLTLKKGYRKFSYDYLTIMREWKGKRVLNIKG